MLLGSGCPCPGQWVPVASHWVSVLWSVGVHSLGIGCWCHGPWVSVLWSLGVHVLVFVPWLLCVHAVGSEYPCCEG